MQVTLHEQDLLNNIEIDTPYFSIKQESNKWVLVIKDEETNIEFSESSRDKTIQEFIRLLRGIQILIYEEKIEAETASAGRTVWYEEDNQNRIDADITVRAFLQKDESEVSEDMNEYYNLIVENKSVKNVFRELGLRNRNYGRIWELILDDLAGDNSNKKHCASKEGIASNIFTEKEFQDIGNTLNNSTDYRIARHAFLKSDNQKRPILSVYEFESTIFKIIKKWMAFHMNKKIK